ncbi:hypothetical protein GCM10010317_013580 [Streptomyces mirabilis]|uniref:hypothetical protein n=1 Tax=Streptomyces mirabilis TaxID=68239 RepID=UPI0019987E51|nr:hypothetical protein [Streptomyces mirabilis]GHD42289.1 hypothetical protein GCM10010317_013580 [Streptomyces mirabilis]
MSEVWEYYRDEVLKLGRPDPGPSPIGRNRVVALAEDPDKGWEQMARESGQYRVLTPERFVAELKSSPRPFTQFHPLCGGMPMELAWSSLRLFEREVLPAFT